MHYVCRVCWDVMTQFSREFDLRKKNNGEFNKYVIVIKNFIPLNKLKAEFRCVHPLLHPKWFPVNGIMTKECRPVPFPYIWAFVRLWMGSFSLCPLSGGSGFVFMWGGRVARIHVRLALSASIFLSVPVILHVQLVLHPDLWPFLSLVPERSEEGRRVDRQAQRENV